MRLVIVEVGGTGISIAIASAKLDGKAELVLLRRRNNRFVTVAFHR